MIVRTDLLSGESTAPTGANPVNALNKAWEIYQTANQVAENALTDPNALKLFMNYLPSANS